MSERDDLPGASAWPFERKCPECGKKFCVPMTETWTYRDKAALLCSWSCVRRREEKARQKAEAAARKKAKKKLTPGQKEGVIRRCVFRGMTNEEISAETGMSMQLVNYYRRKIEEDAEE